MAVPVEEVRLMQYTPRPRSACMSLSGSLTGHTLILHGETMKLVFCLCLAAVAAVGQRSVTYDVSFENAVHHEAVVVATFSGAPLEPLELRMSRSSPGRYALHEFAK